MVGQLSLWDEALNVRAQGQNGAMLQAPTQAFRAELYTVAELDKRTANEMVVRHHYLHRKPANSYSFGLRTGCCTS